MGGGGGVDSKACWNSPVHGIIDLSVELVVYLNMEIVNFIYTYGQCQIGLETTFLSSE